MKVLIAEDDLVSRRMLEALLSRWGFQPVLATDGQQALDLLGQPGGPLLAILDWMMPVLDGVEVCRRVRAAAGQDYTYLIVLTARGERADLLEGLAAGADDYLTKPFDPDELRSRLRVGERVLALQAGLAAKVRELEGALRHVKQLQGLLPVCMHCKKVRDESQIWHRVEAYIEEHSQARVTHALCDECLARFYPAGEGEGEDGAG
ncbi:MAG TPA: response regulator transcription factor [Myxococcota bacterium]|nr:response regulator transcription factor [Myxococcota bacterium]HRY97265.1 response regulator transcription factor [Myxococcota bacterium]